MTHVTGRGNMEAAEHFAAIHDPDADPRALEAALDWLQQNEANAASYRRIARFTQACDDIREVLPRADIEQAVAPLTKRSLRRLLTPQRALAASATLLIVGIAILLMKALGYGWPTAAHPTLMHYATATGESRSVRLADGSMVALGGASAISVRFSADARDIELTDGEAFFTVAHDKMRPFIVSSGTGSVRAVGTQFNVHRTAQGVDVAVAEGRVTIHSAQHSTELGAGMQVSYASDGNLSAISHVDPARIAGWREGVLSFRSQPLSQVVADLNRYSTRPVIIDSYELATEQITGKVRVASIPDWLSGLAATGDIEIRDGPSGSILLTKRPQRKSVDIQ